MYGVVWFREDLRIRDNHALHFAARQCSSGIIGIYIINLEFLKKHDTAACRVEFTLRGLEALSADLKKLNIPLLIFTINRTSQTASTILQVIRDSKAQALYFNRQYEIDEYRRDQRIEKILSAENIPCYSYDDQIILPPASVKNRQGNFFKIFTPYKKVWQKQFSEITSLKLLSSPKKQASLAIKLSPVPTAISGYHSSINPNLWSAGEKFARQRLRKFIRSQLFSYDKNRDFPAIADTSQLSPYLAAGMISPRECFLAALKANHLQLTTGNKGAVTWMTELIWRDFYKHILAAAPRLSMSKPFQSKTEKLPWNQDKKLFTAWCQGKTGIPIVDAAMRQLNTTGWMHNRLRMIVACFLAKNLQIDWRWGEKYFMQHLIDGDLAANNGGWQWSASTGADALPYFRVFNPFRQSLRFDPDGEFIRHYCPELKTVLGKGIHNPQKYRHLKDYPQPIVDLEKTRKLFIANYKKFVLHEH
jgi:deoxyribodipyrimidine photo-lyase